MSRQGFSQQDDSAVLPAPADRRGPGVSFLAVVLAGIMGIGRGLRWFLLFLGSLPRKSFRLVWWFCRTNWEAGFVGPLFFFDLVRLARRGRSTVLRCGYALSLLLMLCFLIVNSFPHQYRHLFFGYGNSLSISEWASFARTCIAAILTVQSAAILILTPAYLGSAIAEEKERHTVELLLTTRLSDRQLVLGKFFGRLLHLAMILFAAVPILTLTRLWGGIDDNMLLGGLVVAFFSLLSSGAISILCSVMTRRLLGAVIAAYMAVFLFNTACMVVPRTSSVLFLSAWDRVVEEEWKFWQEQIESAQQFLGKNSPALAAVPPPPQPDATAILRNMLIPFVAVHLSIFLLCTGTTILIVRSRCLALGQPLVAGVPDLPEADVSPARSKGERPAPDARDSLSLEPEEKSGLVRPAASSKIRLPPIAKGGRNLTSGLYGETKDIPLVDDRQTRVTTQLLEPISDPALLWKEIYQAAVTGPGPNWHDWRTSLWQPSLLLLSTAAATSGFILWYRPELWRSAIVTLNVVFKVLTVIAASITAGLLAFRSGASISGERELGTLDGLLTLPIERIDILRAKWLGTMVRYRLCFYVLLTIWGLGVATGAIHPLAAILVAAVCSAHFAFVISLGLWLSRISRNTLWAHMRLAAVFLFFFCTGFLGLLDNRTDVAAGEISLADRVMHAGLIPECSWWFSSFSWLNSPAEVAGGASTIWHQLMDTGLGIVLFGGAAWLFWVLARRHWEPR